MKDLNKPVKDSYKPFRLLVEGEMTRGIDWVANCPSPENEINKLIDEILDKPRNWGAVQEILAKRDLCAHLVNERIKERYNWQPCKVRQETCKARNL